MARLFNGTSDRGTAAVNLSAYSLLSVSFWAWVDAFSGTAHTATAHALPASSGSGFYLQPWNGTKPEVGMFVAANQFWADTFPTPTAAGWHHYLWIGNRATPLNTVYVDGLLQTLTSILHAGATYGNYTNATLEVGSGGGATAFLSGREAELAIWGGVALTAADAKALANKALPTAQHPANLVGYWPLAGGQSPEPDVSGAGAGSITFTAYKPVQGPIYTNQGLPPAMPPIVRGHPGMNRSRAFFPTRLSTTDVVAVTIAGTSTLSASLTPYQRFTISIGGTSALTASVTPLHRLTVTLAGTSTLSAAVTPYQRLTPTLAGTSSLSASLTPYQRISPSLAGSSTLATSVTAYQRITAALAGTSTLAASVTPFQTITPTLAGQGSLTATVTAYQGLAATIAGTSALTASLTPYARLNPTLAGTSTLTTAVTPIGPTTPTSSGLAGQRRRVRIDERVRRDDELLILLSAVL